MSQYYLPPINWPDAPYQINDINDLTKQRMPNEEQNCTLASREWVVHYMTSLLGAVSSGSIEIVPHFADIDGDNPAVRLVRVAQDETNAGDKTLYLFNGTALEYLLTLPNLPEIPLPVSGQNGQGGGDSDVVTTPVNNNDGDGEVIVDIADPS